ncbi:hypothetical protein ASPCADRAFT_135193 [Aspergillus carbonarius ITEM 5010]|uniref:Uncharacterized protein n=1 Tax=Aspergillus carbonarius (strain ITEM 5010) TaxID=602072 RepID=A0A1R3R7E3_ASPC5|nr:hypothetical protein ASPCADRAFT_135193 [Aspergillus carbonarius ITEM 5010]
MSWCATNRKPSRGPLREPTPYRTPSDTPLGPSELLHDPHSHPFHCPCHFLSDGETTANLPAKPAGGTINLELPDNARRAAQNRASDSHIPSLANTHAVRLGVQILCQIPDEQDCAGLFSKHVNPNDGWIRPAGRHSSKQMWSVFRSNLLRRSTSDLMEVAAILTRLEFLLNLFLLERLLTRYHIATEQDLIDVSQEMLDLSLIFWRKKNRFIGLYSDFEWLIGHVGSSYDKPLTRNSMICASRARFSSRT